MRVLSSLDLIILFIINRYDSTTGTFTVPSDGDGFYYFSVYLAIDGGAAFVFDVEVNGQLLCSVNSDLSESPSTDRDSATCSGITYVSEGNIYVRSQKNV